eukprot:CAMPEP_0172152004 /NCGR_PEP_ID=MMETSP1050-20130122/575_1 /TAXON_ID=233186 /ORGANISM="Cryptomonas curvata, Strain CCAP979/52" /LENGTH=53 /DNA_ID=CAMNT_0012820235 /DNA_START=387 /DNA_END=545 /DNA_ORIENTATION=+
MIAGVSARDVGAVNAAKAVIRRFAPDPEHTKCQESLRGAIMHEEISTRHTRLD